MTIAVNLMKAITFCGETLVIYLIIIRLANADYPSTLLYDHVLLMCGKLPSWLRLN